MKVLLCLKNNVLSKYLYFYFHHHFLLSSYYWQHKTENYKYILYNRNSAINIHIFQKFVIMITVTAPYKSDPI